MHKMKFVIGTVAVVIHSHCLLIVTMTVYLKAKLTAIWVYSFYLISDRS